jgi:hypothetical protein
MSTEPLFEYTGNFHIHTTYSDGTGSVKEVARAARESELDFIALNDHAHQTPLHLEDEGYHKGILVLVGSEIGGRFNHYLAYNIKKQVGDGNISPQDAIDAVNNQGGFGFIAHPFEKGMAYMENNIAYVWDDWSVAGYTGICIWNFSSRWKENVKSFRHGIFHLIFKKYTLKGPSRKTLTTWDELCLKRRTVAIGGSDAHASSVKVGLLRITPLSYRYLLGTINTHVLTAWPLQGDPIKDRELVYNSLKEGNCFAAHDGLFPARGFRFCFIRDEGKGKLEMGQEGKFGPGVLSVKVPEEGLARIIRNGSLFEERYGSDLNARINEKGVYRVEVFRKTCIFGLRPWIFSNPLYLR